MANKWSEVWLFVMQLAGLSSAFGQTPIVEGSGSCSIYILGAYGASSPATYCAGGSSQAGPRGTTTTDSVSAYADFNTGPRLYTLSGTTSYASRYDYGDLGIGLESNLRSDVLPGEGRTAANARFKDYISVSSTTLPVGRPVTLNISGVLDWSAATSIAGRQGNSLSSIYLSSLVAVNQSTIFTGVYDDGDPNRVSPGDTFLANPHTVFSGVYQTRIGDTLEILGTLS